MIERTPITHVAIRLEGVVYSLPKPNRHHDVIRLMVETLGRDNVTGISGEAQGFLDESGRFLNRKQALVSAQLHNQIRADRPIIGGQLYSENLW